MGILAKSLPGNLTIWREILTFEIKKYMNICKYRTVYVTLNWKAYCHCVKNLVNLYSCIAAQIFAYEVPRIREHKLACKSKYLMYLIK